MPVCVHSRTALYRYGIMRYRSSRYLRQIGSTCALCNSARSSGTLGVSIGPVSPVFQPHGSRSIHVRPCERNSVLKAANWNHRTYSSPVNSFVGTKPPISVPQYGMPVSPVFTATGM